MSNIANQLPENDEINLVELTQALWREKLIILASVIIVTLAGAIYSYTATPIYKVKAQLTIPSRSDLLSYKVSTLNEPQANRELNDEQLLTPKDTFNQFLALLDSRNHKENITVNNEALSEKAFGFPVGPDSFDKKMRTVTSNKPGPFSDNVYHLTAWGTDNEALSEFILKDLEIASQTMTDQLKNYAISSLQEEIKIQQHKNKKELLLLEDKINSRKRYVLSARSLNQIELENALKITQSLKLEEASELAKSPITRITREDLTSILKNDSNGAENSNNSIQLNFSDNLRLAYLRGQNFISAELENLKTLKNTEYLDKAIIYFESEKTVITKASNVNILQQEINNIESITKRVPFFNGNIEVRAHPVKPRKTLIISIAFILGGMLGLFIALIITVVKKQKAAISY